MVADGEVMFCVVSCWFVSVCVCLSVRKRGYSIMKITL